MIFSLYKEDPAISGNSRVMVLDAIDKFFKCVLYFCLVFEAAEHAQSIKNVII